MICLIIITNSTWNTCKRHGLYSLQHQAIPSRSSQLWMLAHHHGRVSDWYRCVVPANEPPIFNAKRTGRNSRRSEIYKFSVTFRIYIAFIMWRIPSTTSGPTWWFEYFFSLLFSSLLRSNKQHRLNGIGSLTLLMMQDWPPDGFVAASDGMSRT